MAKKYKSEHERLGITFAEFGALLGTEAMLREHNLQHTPVRCAQDKHSHKFNMGMACDFNGCGTVSCIGGTMALIMGMNTSENVCYYVGARLGEGRHSPALKPLFFPNVRGIEWDAITPAQALKAIANFKKDRKPCWKQIIKG